MRKARIVGVSAVRREHEFRELRLDAGFFRRVRGLSPAGNDWQAKGRSRWNNSPRTGLAPVEWMTEPLNARAK